MEVLSLCTEGCVALGMLKNKRVRPLETSGLFFLLVGIRQVAQDLPRQLHRIVAVGEADFPGQRPFPVGQMKFPAFIRQALFQFFLIPVHSSHSPAAPGDPLGEQLVFQTLQLAL